MDGVNLEDGAIGDGVAFEEIPLLGLVVELDDREREKGDGDDERNQKAASAAVRRRHDWPL